MFSEVSMFSLANNPKPAPCMEDFAISNGSLYAECTPIKSLT